jgi:hypothetical protein
MTSQSDSLFHKDLHWLKEACLNAATYAREMNPESDAEYRRIRLEWLQHSRFKNLVPAVIQKNRSLAEVRSFSQKISVSYEPRREHINDAFDSVLTMLESDRNHETDRFISNKLEVVDSEHVQEAWQKALVRRSTDPEGAITSARTLLEAVCKHILGELGDETDYKGDLTKLYGAVAKQLNLAPSSHTEQIFKQILGGCYSVVEGLAALRNKHSDAHGKSKSTAKPSERHAELAVNLAGAMSVFLIATFEFRQQRNLRKE